MIVVVCSRAAVADVVRRLRAGVAEHATTAAEELDGAEPVVEPLAPVERAGVDPIDSDHAVRLLHERHALTDMQCIVLGLRFRGWTNAAVADAVGIEVGTVKAHVHGAKRRIGAASSTRVDIVFRRTVRELATRPLDPELAAAMGQCSWYRTLLTAARRDPTRRASAELRRDRAGRRVDDPKVDGTGAGGRPG